MKTLVHALQVAAPILLALMAVSAQPPPLPKPAPEITRLCHLFLGSWRISEQHEQGR